MTSTSPPYDAYDGDRRAAFIEWLIAHARTGDTYEGGLVLTIQLARVGAPPATLHVVDSATVEVSDDGLTWRVLHDQGEGGELQNVSRLAHRTLYLAGPMTGYPHFNYPAFNDTAAALREVGYDVLNPASNAAQPSWDGYLRQALHQVLSADAVALLPGWEASAGARLEVHVAHQLRMTTMPFHLWLERAHLVEVGR